MPVVRNAIYDIFTGFDFGSASDSVGARPATVVPAQALLMMNSAFVEDPGRPASPSAAAGGRRLEPEARIDAAFVAGLRSARDHRSRSTTAWRSWS